MCTYSPHLSTYPVIDDAPALVTLPPPVPPVMDPGP